MRVFLNAIYGQLFLNAYIFWRGYRALPPKKAVRTPFILFFVLELLLYFTGYFFYKDLPDSILIPIMLICNTWYIASIYITLGLIVLELVRLSNRKWSWYPEKIKKRWRTVKLALFAVFVIFVAALLVQGYQHANYPVVRHVNIHIPKATEGRDSLIIALMSDLHIGESVGKKNVQRFVELCNIEHPDMVVIVGDIMDYESRLAENAHIEEDLQRLKAPLGVYMVLGNHEYRANRFAKIRWIEKTGGCLLVDSVAMPDSTFYLIGRDDLTNAKRASLETLMQGVDTAKPVIVVDHQPVFARDVIDNKCDMGLFGHTHRGQYWPLSLLYNLAFEFFFGYYAEGGTQIYVTAGIGFAGPPYRVGTRSELVVLHITFDRL
ncbi:MAG: metallophosphoesterase [Tannerella sp.]|jgi:predicted MPP superfamily phosphohydrolase|nr:metallophosphoesterase [Tannerella sp.]